MSWSETIKINSDMTVSLDKLIKSAKSELIDLINSQRSLGASDTIMKVLLSGSFRPSDNYVETEVARFTVRKSGSVRLIWDMQSQSSDDYIRLSVIADDGTKLMSEKTYYSEHLERDISVDAGTTYIVYAYRTGAGSVSNVKIGASVIDASFIS